MTVARETEASVLGAGNMGSAIAKALLRSGRSVTVWNRSPGRLAALECDGVRASPTVEDALAVSDLLIVCLAEYANFHEIMDAPGLAQLLPNRTVVNVMVGSASAAEDMSIRVRDSGASYLDGSIPVYPSGIGSPDTALWFAGSSSAWCAHRELLTDLGGRARFLGEDVRVPNVLENALPVWFYHASHIALLEAAAAAIAAGVPLEALRDGLPETLRLLETSIRRVFDDYELGLLTNDQASLRAHLDALKAAGEDASMTGTSRLTLGSATAVLEEARRAGKSECSLAGLLWHWAPLRER